MGSGPYRGVRSAESTVGFAIPIELGGKRGARVAVANAQLSRAEIQAAIIAADVRLQVTQLYVEAVAADRRVATARDQARIASDALRAAVSACRRGVPPRSNNSVLTSLGSMLMPMSSGRYVWRKRRDQSGAPDRSADRRRAR
jgi:outer membrane protein TolC